MAVESPVVALMKLISGFQISQAVSAMANLGIADVLKDETLHSDDIARAVQCDPGSLYRLLHALASVGLLEEQSDQRFQLTPVGDCLRSNSLNSRSAWARYVGRPYVWQSWGNLAESVKSGKSAFELLHDANLWEWRGERSEETNIFDAAMSELSRGAGSAIAPAHDFSSYEVIVDIGGGQGALLAAILSKHASPRGILFDLPHVVAKAKDLLASMNVGDRCEIIAGDVFKSIPKGGDAYLIKSVLMDESDENTISILRSYRFVMKPTARVIVIEHLLTAPNQLEANYSDLTMMMRAGSQGRSSSWMDFDPNACPEEPAQTCLIGKADAQGYFARRCRAGSHQMTRPLQPSPHHVSVRLSEGFFEGPREMCCASLRYGAEVSLAWMAWCRLAPPMTRFISQSASWVRALNSRRSTLDLRDCCLIPFLTVSSVRG